MFTTLRLAPRLARPLARAPMRALHTSKNSFFTSRTKPTRPLLRLSRGYQSQAVPDQAGLMRKLLVGGAVFGGTLVATNLVFNRETREDGGMPTYERSYLNSTFLHTGAGVGIIALSVRQMVRSGFVFRLMATNPWVFAIGGLGMSFATMIGARSVDADK